MKEITVNEPKSKTINNVPVDVAKTGNKDISQIIQAIVSHEIKPLSINFLHNESEVFNGFVEFSVSLDSLGITANDVLDIKNSIFFKQFLIRFVGEYILRNNIADFMDAIVKSKIDMAKCKQVVDFINSKTQTTFGLKMNKTKTELRYSFHIKVFEEISGDDFRI